MISIVTPVYNEEDNVAYFHDEVTRVMEGLAMDYEILYINDGSADSTEEKLAAIAAADSHVRAVTFARNFGHQIWPKATRSSRWTAISSIRRRSFRRSSKNGRKDSTWCRPSAPPRKTRAS